MSNAICHDGFCEPTLNSADSITNRADSTTMTLGAKISIIGGSVLAVVAWAALLWYEVSLGIYLG